jgi:hypothetical protein
MKCSRVMKGLTWCAPAVVLPSGRVLVGTGFCFLLLEDECGFLGHVRRRWCSAPDVAGELERCWSQPGSVDLLTALQVLPPSSS